MIYQTVSSYFSVETTPHPDDNEVKVNESLPQERKDAIRIYYADHNLRMTTWNLPNTQKANSTEQLKTGDQSECHIIKSSDDLGPLPAGWDIAETDGNRMFFIDRINKKVTYIDPRTGKLMHQPSTHPEIIQNGPLPDNWEVRTSPDGRHYYIDHSKEK
ncbi:hypothetical protein I4U23_022592 [Adineta vaga]|nr:hypothetical protein I4U23_022592 [Adineta vaga]